MAEFHRHAILTLAMVLSLNVPLLLAGAHSASAEYDANGRYVPSPMGKPSDPYRSYVPGYTGTPGAPKRFAPTPRAFRVEPPLPNLKRFEDAPERRINTAPLPVVYPTAAQCKTGWSRALAIPRTRFTKACRQMGVARQR